MKVKFAVRSSGSWILFGAENSDIIDAQLVSNEWTSHLKIILPVRFGEKPWELWKNKVKEKFLTPSWVVSKEAHSVSGQNG